MYAKMTMYMNNTLLKHENDSIRLECPKMEIIVRKVRKQM